MLLVGFIRTIQDLMVSLLRDSRFSGALIGASVLACGKVSETDEGRDEPPERPVIDVDPEEEPPEPMCETNCDLAASLGLAVGIIWIQQFGSAQDDYAYGLALDQEGDVYIVGSTAGSIGGTPSAGGLDAYAVKLSSTDGELLWGHQWGSAGNDYGNGIAIDPRGTTFVVGGTDGDLAGTGLNGPSDMFLTRITDPSASIVEVNQFGSADYDWANRLVVDENSHVYIVGDSSAEVDEEGRPVGAEGQIIKIDGTAGELIWSHALALETSLVLNSLALHSSGDIYVAGNVEGDDGAGVVVSRRDALTGEEVWTFRPLGDGHRYVNDIAFASTGSLMGIGAVEDPLAVSAGDGWFFYIPEPDVPSAQDGFFTQDFGTTQADTGTAIAAYASGVNIFGGITYGDIDTEGSHGGADGFVGTLYDDGTGYVEQFGTSGDEIIYDLAVDPNGDVIVLGTTTGVMEEANRGGVDAFVLKLDL